MQDPRVTRQTIQAYLAILLAAAAPSLLATPFDWRVLVGSLVATITALLTNPRLVAGVAARMPAAGSSAVLPVTTLIANPEAAAPVPSSTPTPITSPQTPRAKDGGYADPHVLAAIVCALACAFVWLFGATMSHATCPPESKLCHGPSLTLAPLAINLRTGDAYAGVDAVPLGLCYGLSAPKVYALGVDFCFNAQVSKAAPNRYFPSFMLHFDDYLNAGLGAMGQQRAGGDGLFWQWLVLIGGRLPVAQF